MLDKKIVEALKARAKIGDQTVMRGAELKSLFDELKTKPSDQRAEFGKAVNNLKQELESILEDHQPKATAQKPIDLTAPFDVNSKKPELLPANEGSVHPLMRELDEVLQIYARMGFASTESRQLDDDWHMFESLNFPPDHPARDNTDTFEVEEGLLAPAHTSTMQNRIMSANKHLLEQDQPIAYVIPGRVFRNEDVDARHEHTFYQLEGIYVDKGINAGHLVSVLQTFFEAYFGKKMEVRTQPFYFPFTEPSFEFSIACPFCEKTGCNICGEGWLELLGCGMIHPNVLKMAGIDPEVYTGFAWGGGIERMVMVKNNIEDIRHFHSANLKFLRQFK